MTKRIILTVKGSWSYVYPDIYQVVDKEISLVPITQESDLKREAHGVLLQGGADINPSLYHQKLTHSQGLNPKRDWLELMLLKRASQEKLPVLGVCRGHQMIAVAYGGELHQDLWKDSVIVKPHNNFHSIEAHSDELERHLPTLAVNSFHHQAVSRVPRGFRTAAVSMDGVIEAIYKPGILGVQWHPEELWQTDGRWAHLFEWHVRGLRSDDDFENTYPKGNAKYMSHREYMGNFHPPVVRTHTVETAPTGSVSLKRNKGLLQRTQEAMTSVRLQDLAEDCWDDEGFYEMGNYREGTPK